MIGFWVLVLLADALCFLMAYAQPADSYTGQDYDRAFSWFLLGVLAAASALAFAVARLPVSCRRLRASARSGGRGVREQPAGRQPWRLAGTLMTFNAPVMIVTAVAAALAAIAVSWHHAPPGALLWAAAAGVIAAVPVTALEVFLLRRDQPICRATPRSG